MAVARKIAYNVAVNTVLKILSTVLALVAIGFITRYLGKEGFGNYATVLAFLSFFTSLTDLGLYNISTREISRPGADEEKIMGNVFSLRIISSFLVLVIAPILVFFLDYPIEVKEGIIIVAASFIFSSGYQILNGVFQKNLAMDKVSIGEFLGKIFQVAAVILAIKMRLGFSWIVLSLLLNMAVSFLIVFFWSRKYIKFEMHFDFNYWKTFLKESLPLGIATIITFVYFKMDTILLSILKGPAEVGIYNAAYKVIENITFFPAMIAGLVLPLMAKYIFTDRKSFEQIADKTFKFFIILVIPLIIGTLFLAKDIIGLIGGAGFSEATGVLKILVFALAMIFFGSFFNTVIIVGNMQKKLMVILSFVAATNVALNLIFIPKFSYLASAYISVLTEFLVVVLTFYLTYQNIKYVPSLDKKSGILFSAAAMATFLFVFSGINFIFLALGSAVVYFVFLWVFKTVKTSEILSLISKKGVEEYEEIP